MGLDEGMTRRQVIQRETIPGWSLEWERNKTKPAIKGRPGAKKGAEGGKTMTGPDGSAGGNLKSKKRGRKATKKRASQKVNIIEKKHSGRTTQEEKMHNLDAASLRVSLEK